MFKIETQLADAEIYATGSVQNFAGAPLDFVFDEADTPFSCRIFFEDNPEKPTQATEFKRGGKNQLELHFCNFKQVMDCPSSTPLPLGKLHGHKLNLICWIDSSSNDARKIFHYILLLEQSKA